MSFPCFWLVDFGQPFCPKNSVTHFEIDSIPVTGQVSRLLHWPRIWLGWKCSSILQVWKGIKGLTFERLKHYMCWKGGVLATWQRDVLCLSSGVFGHNSLGNRWEKIQFFLSVIKHISFWTCTYHIWYICGPYYDMLTKVFKQIIERIRVQKLKCSINTMYEKLIFNGGWAVLGTLDWFIIH